MFSQPKTLQNVNIKCSLHLMHDFKQDDENCNHYISPTSTQEKEYVQL